MGLTDSDPTVSDELGGVPRIKRCLSSPSLSSSLSRPSVSNVSANVLSASVDDGSSRERWRAVGDEARERNEGGGEEGLILWSR